MSADCMHPQIDVAPDNTAARLREYVRNNPDIRKDQYDAHDDAVEGACYVLAEAYFHARGGEDGPFEVYRLDWGDIYDDADGAHWFLRDGDTVVDLSLPAPSDGESVPWDQARHRAFITGYEPSNRTKRVLSALGIDH